VSLSALGRAAACAAPVAWARAWPQLAARARAIPWTAPQPRGARARSV